MKEIRKHTDLKVFQLSFEAGVEIFHMIKNSQKKKTTL